MLRLENGSGLFTRGSSGFSDHAEGFSQANAKVFVKIEPGSLGSPILAQLDTGAAYSMLETEVAEALALLDSDGTEISISTRLGEVRGRLERIRITLVADEGEPLTIEGPVFVSRDWSGGTFLGYSGLLDQIRFAVDPSNNVFHFGRL